jgi:hypothetical protein
LGLHDIAWRGGQTCQHAELCSTTTDTLSVAQVKKGVSISKHCQHK